MEDSRTPTWGDILGKLTHWLVFYWLSARTTCRLSRMLKERFKVELALCNIRLVLFVKIDKILTRNYHTKLCRSSHVNVPAHGKLLMI